MLPLPSICGIVSICVLCESMYKPLAAAISSAPAMHSGLWHWLRRPVVWVALWAVWCLLALGYFAYRDALDGLICRAAP